jgi:3-dehydroquinate synthase
MPALAAEVVPVALAGRAYEVHVSRGLLDRAGALIAPFAPRRRVAVVTDETVAALHLPRLAASLETAGLSLAPVVLPPGEGTKSFTWLERLSDALLAQQLDRGDLVVAFGGGVVGDLTGFAAAIYKRGIDFVQIPTTLLAQVDSSVGGKTAIDTPRGKNLIGAFHQPRLVLADLDVLGTLSDRELRCGHAEVLKHGLLGDAEFFAWLETATPAVLAREPAALARAVRRSVEMKAAIVAEDEREAGVRALLNLGHTFGHAFEAEVGFENAALLHGEAVGLGLCLAFRFSAALGHCSDMDAARAAAAVAAAGLPTRLADIPGHPFSAERLLDHMRQDKKASGGDLTFVLVHGVGRAFVARGVEPEAVRRFLISEGAV